jgi:hypothetical protein
MSEREHWESFGFADWTLTPEYKVWKEIVIQEVRETGNREAIALAQSRKTRDALKVIQESHPETYAHMKAVYALLFV